jgi:hypothetical protein
MRRKLLILMLMAIGCAVIAFAQRKVPLPGTPEQDIPEEVILQLLERNSKYDQVPEVIDGLCLDLREAGVQAARQKSQKIVDAILAFPADDPYVLAAKIRAFRNFTEMPDAVHDFVTSQLRDTVERVRREAARALVQWKQDLDTAVPVLVELGDFLVLQQLLDTSSVEGILREGAWNCPLWEGRWHAAYALQAYGDSATVMKVALDILARAPIGVEDNSIARAKHQALNLIIKRAAYAPVADIARLADDENLLVRMTSVELLTALAFHGSSEARAALEQVAAQNQDPNLRVNAATAISRLDSASGRQK